MAIEDVMRGMWEQLPPVTRNMLAITAVVGLADFVLGSFGIDLVYWLGLMNIGWSSFHGAGSFHIWQPLTYMFMHSNVWHWICNMLAVWMFGMTIEREWGSKKYLIYYLVCGIGAAIVQELVWMMTTHGPAVTIGASGAVFGILFAFAWLFPEQKMFLLFVPIPIPSRVFVAIYALFELSAGVASVNSDHIAHFAHLGGMLFGWLLILWWKHKDDERKNRFQGKDFSNYHYKDPS